MLISQTGKFQNTSSWDQSRINYCFKSFGMWKWEPSKYLTGTKRWETATKTSQSNRTLRYVSVSRLFHVGHLVQNTRGAISLAWHECFSCKGKEWKIHRCRLALSSEPQIWKFHVVIWQTRQKIAPRGVPHVQHDYFPPFNQWNHCFVALTLPLLAQFLKLEIIRKLISFFVFNCYKYFWRHLQNNDQIWSPSENVSSARKKITHVLRRIAKRG